MARVRINFEVRQRQAERLRERLERVAGARVRNNFGDFRPFIERAINRAVNDNKNDFIPDVNQAGELGVGRNRSIDREKTDGAWRQLFAGEITSFSVRQRRGARQLGTIKINIDERRFFEAPLSIVETADGELPWMRWFIRGASIEGYEFDQGPPVPRASRTGRGVMVEGGLWRFRAPNPRAIENLLINMRLRVENSIRRNAGSVLR